MKYFVVLLLLAVRLDAASLTNSHFKNIISSGFLTLSGLTNRLTDDGSTLLYNGVPIAIDPLWTSDGTILSPSPAVLFLGLTNTAGFAISVGDSYETNVVNIAGGGSDGIDITINGVPNKMVLKPGMADGDTPYIFDTSISHTSGSLFDIKNSTTNVLNLLVGGAAYDYTLSLTATDETTVAALYANSSGAGLGLTSGGVETYLLPYEPDGFTPYKFDTSIAHTTGNLFELLNNSSASGTNIVQFDWSGAAVFHGIGDNAHLSFKADPIGDHFGSSAHLELVANENGGDLIHLKTSPDAGATQNTKFRVDEGGAVIAESYISSLNDGVQTVSPGSGNPIWKLGPVVTEVAVSLVTTNYVEVDIGGTVRKLALVQ